MSSKNNILIKDLVDYGLSEKEAQMYIALLELEIAPVNEVAKKADVNRSSAYVVLESLKEKGLVAVSDDASVQQFVASSPEVLLRTAKDSSQRQAHVLERLKEIVPELKGLHKGLKKKPKVIVYEGKEGLITSFEKTLDSKEKIMRVASSLNNLTKILPKKFFIDYINKRIDAGVKLKGIHPNGLFEKIILKTTPSADFDEVVLVPKSEYKFPADIAIFDDTIGYMSKEDGGVAISIESKEIAEVMKNIFDLAYTESKRMQSK